MSGEVRGFGSLVFASAFGGMDGFWAEGEDDCGTFGKGPAGKGVGPFWILGMSWNCVRRPADGTVPVNTGHKVSSSSSSKKRSRPPTRRWWTLHASLPQTLRMAGPSPIKKGEHTVENFMLCSFAHHACSPLLQGFLHDEELCNVALTCHFSLDVLFLCQD